MDLVETPILVERTDLEDLLRNAWGDPQLQVRDWKVSKISGGLEFASVIYRLQGSAEAAGNPKAWSLILKVFQPDAQFDDPQGYRYWRRETEAYQSGMLQKLPGLVTAPLCYSVQEKPEGAVWIWLEDVRDDKGSAWSIEQYVLAARILGKFNGAYLASQPLPVELWFTHDWLRKYLEHATPMVAFIQENPAHPVVQKLLPGIALAMSLAVWDERLRILKVLDRLPQTFCHQDAFERNCFIRGEQLVGIDWGYAGVAPLGAELVALVGVASTLGSIPINQLRQVDQACFEAYLQGLREAGWTPDPRKVRLGYVLTVLLRYILGASVGELLPGILQSEEVRRLWAEGFGVSKDKVAETDAGVASYYQSITIEALKLLGLGSMLRVLGGTLRHSLSLGRKRRQTNQNTTGTKP